MRKFKIRSKTPEKEIIKTKLPFISQDSFELPPENKIKIKTPEINKKLPREVGKEEKKHSLAEKNFSPPPNIDKNTKSQFIPTNSGKKTSNESESRKKNKSLPKIDKKIPKTPKVRKFNIKKDTLKKFNKINKNPELNLKNDLPIHDKLEKQIPPKFDVKRNPPKTKIKDKKPV